MQICSVPVEWAGGWASCPFDAGVRSELREMGCRR
jgi:hypothetical protein